VAPPALKRAGWKLRTSAARTRFVFVLEFFDFFNPVLFRDSCDYTAAPTFGTHLRAFFATAAART